MVFRKKKYTKLNIIYIICYIVFLICFPFLRNYLDGNEFSINKGAVFLNLADKSTNIVSSSFRGFVDYFYSKKYLLNEVERLKNELKMKEENSIIESNTNKKELYNNQEIVIAKKIFSDFTSIYNTILLNKGTESGIKENHLVFINTNKAIGRVLKTDKNTSLVILFSKSKEKVEAVITANKNQNTVLRTDSIDLEKENQNKESSSSILFENELDNLNNFEIREEGSKILIDLYGYGGGDFISYIPSNIDVPIGTKVYLAIDESKILGDVVSIEKQDASFFQILLIRGFYNTRENNNYYILKN